MGAVDLVLRRDVHELLDRQIAGVGAVDQDDVGLIRDIRVSVALGCKGEAFRCVSLFDGVADLRAHVVLRQVLEGVAPLGGVAHRRDVLLIVVVRIDYHLVAVHRRGTGDLKRQFLASGLQTVVRVVPVLQDVVGPLLVEVRDGRGCLLTVIGDLSLKVALSAVGDLDRDFDHSVEIEGNVRVVLVIVISAGIRLGDLELVGSDLGEFKPSEGRHAVGVVCHGFDGLSVRAACQREAELAFVDLCRAFQFLLHLQGSIAIQDCRFRTVYIGDLRLLRRCDQRSGAVIHDVDRYRMV